MSDQQKPRYKISKGSRRLSPTGVSMEEEWMTVEAQTKEECEAMFEKRMKK